MKTISTLILILLVSLTSAVAQDTTDKTSIGKALNDFETAIINNDSEKAGKILHHDVTILEGGGMETKSQYLSHHFHSDGKFLAAINREDVSQDIKIEGNVAWVTSKTKMTGTYSGRDIDMTSLELVVLKKENEQWKIVALHWSSR